MKLRELKTIKERKEFLEGLLKIKIPSISVFPKGLEVAQNKNCENMIGSISIPLGIAGPLKIEGDYAKGDFYLPLATTEGALVASMNRGCKAITESGGATVVCRDVGITRSCVFDIENVKKSIQIESWINANENKLKKITEGISSHLKLINIKLKFVSKYLFIRFSFDSMEAMGMNLATFATDALKELIEVELKIKCISIAANFDNDKKPSYLNFLEGRGRTVSSDCLIPRKIVQSVLKTTPEKISQVVKSKIYLGSILSGSFAINAHFANIIAALFISLGQDAAHVAEGSVGITSTEIVNGDLYISVNLPDLPVGTIGGGTGLPSQSEALLILGLKGGKKGEMAKKLAEIVGAAVLAGELSLISSLGEGSLAKAHYKLTGKS